MNFYVILLVIFGVIWLGTIFFGYATGLHKGFKSKETPFTAQTQQIREQQSLKAEEVERRRKEVMDSLKQRIEDNRN